MKRREKMMRIRKSKMNLIGNVLLFLSSFLFLYPLIWMLLMSLKDRQEVYSNPFALPKSWLFSNYAESLSKYTFFIYLTNSIIYSVAAIFIIVFIGSLFAYATSRMKWKMNQLFVNYITVGLIVPISVVIIPLFLLLKDLSIKNTHLELILPYVVWQLPMAIIILYGFFKVLPYELEESAFMEGATIIQTFFKIMLPQVRAAVSTIIAICFVRIWNDFFIAFMITTTNSLRPLPLGLLNFILGYEIEWGLLGASMVVTSIPTVVIYIIFSESIENALTMGAVLK
jgi:raffinose/stachyose/melibiose transport system permease protein